MWRAILLLGILIAAPAVGWCDTVQFSVDPPNTGTIMPGPSSIDVFSSSLNGIVLTGQSLSLDLVFSNDVLARLFLSDPGSFGIGLTLYTTAGTFPGFAGPTTGYLLAANGSQFGGSQSAGLADGSDGSIEMGLDSFTSANLNGANVVDISGVHFITSLPNDGFTVTDAQLRFSLNSSYDAVEFGTAQQLPEPSTLGLTLVGLLAAGLVAGRKHSKESISKFSS